MVETAQVFGTTLLVDLFIDCTWGKQTPLHRTWQRVRTVTLLSRAVQAPSAPYTTLENMKTHVGSLSGDEVLLLRELSDKILLGLGNFPHIGREESWESGDPD